MKYLKSILIALAAFLAVFSVTSAAPVSWDFTSGILRPLQSMWGSEVRVPFITATSTATSTLPFLSSTKFDATTVCVSGDCRTAWPTGGGSGSSLATTTWTAGNLVRVVNGTLIESIATSSLGLRAAGIVDFDTQVQALSVGTTTAATVGNLAFWTGARTLGNVATGTLTETATGLSLSGSPVVIGGSSVLTIDAGFALASTTGLSNLYTFYDTPSSRITAGTGIDWTSNTLNVTLGDFTTANLTESGNLYFTDARARSAISETITGIDYTSGTGVFSLTTGYVIPTSTLWTQVADFYTTPSTRITANDGLTWSGNNLNFDGGNAPGGELGGTWASPTLDDGVAVSNWNLTSPTLTTFFSAACASGEAIQDISDTGVFTCVAVGGGGGGGGSLSTSTDSFPSSQTISYVSTAFYVGGSASNTAEFAANTEKGYIQVSSTTNSRATTTIANVNDALSVQFGVASSHNYTSGIVRGVHFNFSSTTRALVSAVGSVLDFVFDMPVYLLSALKDVTGSAGTSGMVLTSTGTSTRWVATSSLGISGGGGSSNWTDNGTFLTPLTATDGLLVTGSSTFSQLRFDNATTTGSLWLGNNRIWQHPAQFLDIQRTGSDYTLARIRAPRGSSREATLALVVDLSTTDAGVDEEFVDFYNERYGDSLQWGLRQAYSGTGIAKPFVLGHWDTSAGKDAGNKLIILPEGTVAVARATSTIPKTTAFYVASSTAPNLARFDSAPGTAEFVVETDGDTGIGTSTPSAALSVVAQVASTIANFFTSTGSLVMSIASNLVTIFGDTVITGDLYVASSTYYGATTSDAITAMGYLNSGNWINEMCTSPTAEITQVAADVLRGCGRFSYLEDAAGVIDFVRPQTGSSTYFRLRPGAAGTVNAAGDGMAIGWADGVDMGDLQRFEPAMEFALKQDNLANATSTVIFAGITDKVTVGVDAATEPGVGFYVYATSTANWLFACNPATGGTTYINTGVPTSTFATGNANPWTHFRLEVGGTSNTAVTGLLKWRLPSSAPSFTDGVTCSINLAASTAAAAPIVAIGKSTVGQSPELHVPWVKFWYYSQLD